MASESQKQIWIARENLRCSGCKRCEVACSLYHEGLVWPEASRVRVFMLVPGTEMPHLCAQCHDYPCVASCPVDALSVDPKTAAVLVDKEKCIHCGKCIDGCPGKIPHLHPKEGHALICDLCGGDPECVKACHQGKYDCLMSVPRISSMNYRLYARTPEEMIEDFVTNLYGEQGKELI